LLCDYPSAENKNNRLLYEYSVCGKQEQPFVVRITSLRKQEQPFVVRITRLGKTRTTVCPVKCPKWVQRGTPKKIFLYLWLSGRFKFYFAAFA
jgi:hypothetical protein